jgi:hypothetical protein
MAKFEYSPSDIDIDRAYVLVDDTFDLHVLRTEEGLIVDVYQNESDECIGTMAIENPYREE